MLWASLLATYDTWQLIDGFMLFIQKKDSKTLFIQDSYV